MAVPITYVDATYSEVRHMLTIAASIDEFADDPEEEISTVKLYIPGQSRFGHVPIDGMRVRSMAQGASLSWAVGRSGEIWTFNKGQITKEQLPDSGFRSARHLGPPKMLRIIDGTPYVCGYAGQVYTRTASGAWVHIDDGICEPEGTGGSLQLDAIHGTGPNDIYVVGSGGLLARWNGRAWNRIKLLTNVWLGSVRAVSPDHVLAVGDNGVFVEGVHGSWTTIQIPEYEKTVLADVEIFEGKVYVAAVGHLLVREGDDWSVVDHGLDDSPEFVKFAVGDGHLWCVGSKRIHSFDGTNWHTYVDPDNG
jgi:hypothetical protein